MIESLIPPKYEVSSRITGFSHHKELIELKNRCIRLNYKGDFHMDILPGCQESNYDDNKIKIPDKQLGDWASSNTTFIILRRARGAMS